MIWVVCHAQLVSQMTSKVGEDAPPTPAGDWRVNSSAKWDGANPRTVKIRICGAILLGIELQLFWKTKPNLHHSTHAVILKQEDDFSNWSEPSFMLQVADWKRTTAGLASGQRILTKGRIAFRAVIEDRVIHFLRTLQQRLHASQWAGQPANIAPSRDGFSTPSNNGSLAHVSQPTNGISTISIGSVVFAGLIRVSNTQTDRQTTLRATSVAIDRILCTACTVHARCGLVI